MPMLGRSPFLGKQGGCIECHTKPFYTDQALHDVGSKGKYDRRSTFDTPTLIESWRTAPYLHDGQYLTVKELLNKGKHSKKTEKLTDKQIDDLIQFVWSL
jgi:cytochrome c peroxidase